MNTKKIAVFGAGGFGREVAMLIHQINQAAPTYEFVGYFDDGKAKGTMVNGFPVLGGMAEANAQATPLELVFAIGDPATKEKIITQVTNPNITFPTLVHPAVLIGEEVTLGAGSVICAGNILTVNISIGRHVILNLACTVGHDTIIEDYCSFMPGVNISGEVNIRTGVYVGTGAKIINQLEIGEHTIVGAGAVVSKTLPPHCTAVGIPAKPIRFHNA